MRKTAFFLSAAMVVTFAQTHRTEAFVVVCANCSDIVDQLVEKAQQAQQLATQLSSYQTQLQQWSNMVQNTTRLPEEAWADVQNDINQVRNLTNQASLLTGNSGGIINKLNSSQAYLSQIDGLPDNIGSQFTMWHQTFGNASQSLGQTLGVQQNQLNNYTALQAAIQAHSQTAAGQMQAIQASTEMAGLTNTQLNQIQTTLTAQAQLISTKMEIDADRQATDDATREEFFKYVPLSTTGGKNY
jgi:type IV secretion system protein TrbJ